MFFFRWMSGLPAAAAVTLGLFFLMSQLVAQKDVDVGPTPPKRDFTITAKRPEPEVRPETPRPDRIPDRIPETPIDRNPTSRPTNTGPRPTQAKPDYTAPPVTTGNIGAIIKPPPAYPEGCRARSAEGVVVVEFDISPEGNVVNPRILESADRCFDRAVLRAVSGWKYPPAGPGGGMRYRVVETINFQLTE